MRRLVIDTFVLPLALIAILVLLAVACPKMSPPVPVPVPDADAAPMDVDASPAPPVVDASDIGVIEASPPSMCQSACSNMTALRCGGVKANCLTSMVEVEHRRLIVNDAGRPATCKCIAMAPTKAAVESCGIGCQ